MAKDGHHNEKHESEESTCEARIRAYASDTDICEALNSDRGGLIHAEAAHRLLRHGENKQIDVDTVTWKRIAFDSIFNYYNVMLIALVIISIVVPDREWSLFATILIVVPLSAGIQFLQDLRSNNRRTAISESLPGCYVRRQALDGSFTQEEVDRKNIVHGDIVSLSPGDVIPADCIILDSSNLSVSQSSLTGEAEPQVKAFGSGNEKEEKTTVFDLDNVVFSGSSVISGSGLAIVIATGNDAFISSIMQKVNDRRPKNSFQKGIDRTCQFLVAFTVISFVIILVVKGTRSSRWQQAAIFSLSTAATLVPKMLPAVVTANLSRGAFILRKFGVIVNHMDAVHSLGSMSILCSDKTGTLTKDEIELCHSYDSCGRKSSEVFLHALTNACNQRGTKNAIDRAIINHASREDKGVEIGRSVGEIPFNFEARRSSCIIQKPGSMKLICKGAFEEVMARCSHIRVGTEVCDLSAPRCLELNSRIQCFNADAYRVVLVATRDMSNVDFTGVGSTFDGLDSDMTVEGFLTFLDPLKPDAKESITRLQELGVDVRILTGDNLGVAMSVARNLGLGQDLDEGTPLATSGPRLASIHDPEEWEQGVRHCKIFAKLTPAQKGLVVETLQAHGEVVGMIGDGINDSIALKAADVGISVDSGSSVAKNSADLILTEKQLAKVVDAVEIGRNTHGNVMKYMKMILAANFGNVLSVVIAAVWFPFDPISPAQMVLQNLLYDLSQLTIPFDNVDEDYLALPHRFSIRDLMGFILLMGPVISTIDVGTFLLNVFYYGFGPSSDDLQMAKFQSHWFVSGMLSQTLVIYIFRTAKVPFFQSHPSLALLVSTVFASVIGLAIPYIPSFAKALNLVRPGGAFIGIIFACLVLFVVVLQVAKMIYIRLLRRWL